MALQLKRKLVQGGNAYIFRIPKAYIEDGNLEVGQEYHLVVEKPATVGFRITPRFMDFTGFSSVLSCS